MKKISAFLLFIACTVFATQAQTIKWGETIKSDKMGHTPDEILGRYQDSYYIAMWQYSSLSRKSKLFIHQYSISKLNLIKEWEVEKEKKIGEDNLDYQSCIMIGNIIHIYYDFYSKKDQKSRCFVETYTGNFEPIGNLREVMTVGGRKRSEKGDFYREISSDSTKILIVGEDDFKDEDNQRFKLGVFDKKMEKIWGKDIELPYTDELFLVNNFIVDNEGSIYLLGKKFEEKSVEKRKGQLYVRTHGV